MLIHTQRLRLITCDARHLAALVQGPGVLGELLGITVPDGWTAVPAAYAHSLALLKKQPMRPFSGWWLYLLVNPVSKTLVGCCGFKDVPDPDGIVEIGCEIAPVFRRQGYATEALKSLVGYAFTRPEVRAVDARSLPAKGAQAAMLQAVGMKRIGEAEDAEAGTVWHWRITSAEFVALARAARRLTSARR